MALTQPAYNGAAVFLEKRDNLSRPKELCFRRGNS